MSGKFGERLEEICLPETVGKHTRYNSQQWISKHAFIFASFPRHSITTPTFLFMQGKGGIIEFVFLVKQIFFLLHRMNDFQKER